MKTNVVLKRQEHGIAELFLNRPNQLNALNHMVRVELAETLELIAADQDIRVLVVAGTGGEAFAAGADVGELFDLDPDSSEALSLSIMKIHEGLRALPIPVIARIDGWCLGGGLELALACDLRIASEDAKFGFPEIKLGIMPGGGGVARSVAACGPAAALRLCLTGETVNAAEAQILGLVSAVVPRAEVDEKIATLTKRLSGFSRAALAQIKSTIDIAAHTDLTNAQRAEAKACALLFGTEPQRTAMQAFLAKKSEKQTLT